MILKFILNVVNRVQFTCHNGANSVPRLRSLSPTMSSSSTHNSADDDDAPGPPISVPDSGDTGEGGKIKMIVQLVKKCLGVKDIAAMCALIITHTVHAL